MKAYIFFISILIILINSDWVEAQPNAYEALPPIPEAAALGKFVEAPVNNYTGLPDISIPLYTIRERNLAIPISLSYHPSGIKVQENASWVGTGWALNCGGLVSRHINGLPDEGPGGYLTVAAEISSIDDEFLMDVLQGVKDSEQDIFTFSFPGYNGKFFFDLNEEGQITPQIVPKQPLNIDFKATGNTINITTPEGTVYIFGFYNKNGITLSAIERSCIQTGLEPCGALGERSTWKLVRIESHDGLHAINLEYENEDYTYKVRPNREQFRTNITYPNSFTHETTGPSSQAYNLVTIQGKRLNKITTELETIDFEANTDREDLAYGVKQLDAIHISSGAFHKQWEFDYDYFIDPAYPTGLAFYEGKRLKLNQIQLVANDGSEAINPYKFDYVKYEDEYYLPNTLSNAMDYWGYFNGKMENDDNLLNIPDMTYNNFSCTSCGSDRNSEADMMQIGTLSKIENPFGGATFFTFEANRYLPSGANPILAPSGEKQFEETISNCSINYPSPSGACCDIDPIIATSSTPIRLSAEQIANGNCKVKIRKNVNNTDGCPFPIPAATIQFRVYEPNNPSQAVYSSGFDLHEEIDNATQNQVEKMETYELQDMNLQANTDYHFEITVDQVYGELRLYDKIYPTEAPDGQFIVGGLRIENIRVSEGNHDIPHADDIIRTYEYSDGKLFDEFPVYGQPITEIFNCISNCNFTHLPGIVNVNGAVFFDAPLNSLSDISGYHIGYEEVTELHNNNGKRKMTFYLENNPGSESSFPGNRPDAILVDNGKMKEETILDNNDLEKSKNIYTKQPEQYTIPMSSIFKTRLLNVTLVAETPMGTFINQYYHQYKFVYKNRTKYYRHAQVENILDNVSSKTIYSYSADDTKPFPTQQTLMNSDGKNHKTETKYTYDITDQAVYDEMKVRNMLFPIEVRKSVNDQQVGGNRTNYSFFLNTGLPSNTGGETDPIYMDKVEQDERTWINGQPGSENWQLATTIEQYDMEEGKPIRVRQDGWDPELYTWDKGRITTRKFCGNYDSGSKDCIGTEFFEWKYSYHPNTSFLHTSTNIDGQVIEYNYDGLSRLKTTSSRNGNIHTAIDYKDLARNGSSSEDRIATTIEFSDAPSQTSIQTFDGLGRSLKTILNGVVKNEILYDNLGRIDQQTYLPGNFTTFEYEESPLNRITKEIYPDGSFSTKQYANESNYYRVSTTDENGYTTINTTDILGRPYQMIDAINGVSNPTTYLYEDDRHNNPTRIVPPMGEKDTPNPLFDYTYLYDERNRLKEKTIPQGGTMVYDYYNDKDLLKSTTDANGNEVTYEYDAYGRETVKKLDGDTIATNTYDVGGGINMGKMTNSTVGILGTPDFLDTDYVYDEFGRLQENDAENHLGGNDITNYTYNHADWAITSLRKHTANGQQALDIGMGYEYDGFGRITKTIHSLNGQARILSQTAWNNRDQLTRKILGEGLQSIDYQYNERGWLTRINQPLGGSQTIPTCNVSSINGENIYETLESDIFCGHEEQNLAYILSHRLNSAATSYDCYNPCENTGGIHTSPACTPSESIEQTNSITQLRQKMKNTYTTTQQLSCVDGSMENYLSPDIMTLNLPSKLYRVKLCDGSQIYVFEDDLSDIVGTYYIVQEEEIQSKHQIFTVRNDQGILQQIRLEELMLQVVQAEADKDIFVNNFLPNQDPCDPQDYECSQEERDINVQFFIDTHNANNNLTPADLSYPTYLHRVKLCGFRDVYFLEQELDGLQDPQILQTIIIESPDQTFRVGNTFTYLDINDLFYLELHYDEANPTINANAQKNGNISYMDWQVQGQLPNAYGFQYDALNRIKAAKHSVGGNYTVNDAYGVNNISYDGNGNILSLTRHQGNANPTSCYDVIDNLAYSYNGNQLLNIDDTAPIASRNFGFKPEEELPSNYEYDLNGNLKNDYHKNISFTYNYLNLPFELNNLVTNEQLRYTYDANGNKLFKKTANGTEDLDYVQGIEYKDGALEAIYHPEGRIIEKNATFEWQWTLKDHLGNTRVLMADVDNNGEIDASTEVLQKPNYYPFGMAWESSAVDPDPAHRYLYNGKELDTDFGLNWYHYGARMYDPAVGRFTGVDPISDKFPELSTYNYASNSPIANIDLHGLQSVNFGYAMMFAEKNKNGKKVSVEQFTSDINDGTAAAAATVSVFTPGPEDAVIAGAAATRFGGAILRGISKFADNVVDGISGLFKSGNKGLDNIDGLDDAGLAGIKGGSLYRKGKANDFDLIHTKNEFEKSDLYKELTQMSDNDLIKTLNDFSDKWPAIEVKKGKIYRGNNRIYEARRRGLNPDINYREIRDDTFDYFPDLDPNWKPGND